MLTHESKSPIPCCINNGRGAGQLDSASESDSVEHLRSAIDNPWLLVPMEAYRSLNSPTRRYDCERQRLSRCAHGIGPYHRHLDPSRVSASRSSLVLRPGHVLSQRQGGIHQLLSQWPTVDTDEFSRKFDHGLLHEDCTDLLRLKIHW